MATGDPYCSIHGQVPCFCYAWYQKQTNTNDNTNWPISNTYKVEPLYPVADPFADWTYKQYIPSPRMRVKVVPYIEYIPHNRWTKLFMHCEDDWSLLEGMPVEKFRQETEHAYENYMGQIIWSNTPITATSTTATTNTITFSNVKDTGLYYNTDSSYILVSNGTTVPIT